MGSVQGCRIVQITIAVDSQPESIRFYEEAFGVTFDEAYSHFQFGIWPSDQFFLLTLDQREPGNESPGPSRFGFLVDDLESIHRRALAAGATEVDPPHDVTAQPRTSCIGDPSGNTVFLYQS